uniref:Aa_trans domain-containing protein n=1 Tax=Macrostomum lignano TaxID=282301 RepID=A0A1I8FR08_9PLAT
RVLYRSIPVRVVLIILLIRGVTLACAAATVLEFYLTPMSPNSPNPECGKTPRFLGYLAQELNTNVKDVAQSVGLAFIVYPQALMKLPGSTFWAILFFLMLITLGLDSQFHLVETAVTSILDRWPHLRRYKTLMIMTFCIVVFFLGLSMCTPGGLQLLTVFDDYSGAWNVMVITILECVCIGYVYGVRRFVKDVELLTGPRICWLPAMALLSLVVDGLLITLVFSWVKFEPSKYDGEPLPLGAQVFGWTLTLGVLTGLFAWSAASVWQMRSDPGQLIRPTRFWDRRWFDSGVRLPTCRDSRSTRGVADNSNEHSNQAEKVEDEATSHNFMKLLHLGFPDFSVEDNFPSCRSSVPVPIPSAPFLSLRVPISHGCDCEIALEPTPEPALCLRRLRLYSLRRRVARDRLEVHEIAEPPPAVHSPISYWRQQGLGESRSPESAQHGRRDCRTRSSLRFLRIFFFGFNEHFFKEIVKKLLLLFDFAG